MVPRVVVGYCDVGGDDYLTKRLGTSLSDTVLRMSVPATVRCS